LKHGNRGRPDATGPKRDHPKGKRELGRGKKKDSNKYKKGARRKQGTLSIETYAGIFQNFENTCFSKRRFVWVETASNR